MRGGGGGVAWDPKLNLTRQSVNELFGGHAAMSQNQAADIKRHQQPDKRISLKTCHKHCRQLKSFALKAAAFNTRTK